MTLDVLVGTDGRAADIQVDKDAGNGFAEKAIAEVRKWKFNPAIGPNGQLVNARIKVELVFHPS